MALRCPVCKAENAQGPNCRRCKADLSLLFALEDRRARERLVWNLNRYGRCFSTPYT